MTKKISMPRPWILDENSSEKLNDDYPDIVKNAIRNNVDAQSPKQQQSSYVPLQQPLTEQKQSGALFLMWHDEAMPPSDQIYKHEGLPIKTHVYLADFFDYETKEEFKVALLQAYKIMLRFNILRESGQGIPGHYTLCFGDYVGDFKDIEAKIMTSL